MDDQHRGYYTFAIGKLHYAPQRNLYGFHAALLDESGRVESPDFRSDYRSWFASQAPNLDPDATGIGWNAVRFLDTYNRPQPFFLKVSFSRPHSRYDPAQRFWDLYESAAIPPAARSAWSDRYRPRNSDQDEIWHGDVGQHASGGPGKATTAASPSSTSRSAASSNHSASADCSTRLGSSSSLTTVT